MKNVRISPVNKLEGSLTVPGDKSISHRAVMLSSLAGGKSTLKGLLLSEDVRATIDCFREMGVPIEILGDRVEIQGVGLGGLKPPQKVLQCGNSGTTMRLMMGILAGQPFSSRLTGDKSLNQRPMDRVIHPLKTMGAEIEELRAGDTERIIKITGRPLRGIRYELPVASAQVKSAVLLAGLFSKEITQVIEKVPSRDHTEIMLMAKGASLKLSNGTWSLEPPKHLKAENLEVPGDISSAAFFLVAGCLGKGSKIDLIGVGINPTRTGILEILQSMSAQVEQKNIHRVGGEPVADLSVRSSPLKATRIAGPIIPKLIDEIPILSVAAGAAQGTTEIRDAGELRVKETDRIQSLETEIAKLTINIKGLPDGLLIEGPGDFQGAQLESHGDHRIAMSLAVAASYGAGPSEIRHVDCVDTSYPQFFSHLGHLGGLWEGI